MTELAELAKDLKEPPRKAIEDAIRGVVIRVEELPDTTGVMFVCGDVRALAWAAYRCLEAGPLPGEHITKEQLTKAVLKRMEDNKPPQSKSVQRRLKAQAGASRKGKR